MRKLTPEHWRRLEEIYHAALARGESERTAFLADACAGDEALRRGRPQTGLDLVPVETLRQALDAVCGGE
jgi:hypothetical protein